MKRSIRIKHNRNLTFYNSTTKKESIHKDENYCSSPISLESNSLIFSKINSSYNPVNNGITIFPKTPKDLIRNNKSKNISNIKDLKLIKIINDKRGCNLSNI